ncbi:MAG: hypothetical protein QXP77_01435 [Candidatus Aenigmatarchaeota archaeon]
MNSYSILSYPTVYGVSQLTGAFLGLVCIIFMKKFNFNEKQTCGLGLVLALLGTLTIYLTYNFFAPKNPIPSELSFLTVFFGLNVPVLLLSFFLSFLLPFIWEFLKGKIK